MKNFKKGFTLIELLVVVAIIGVLASVVLSYLGSSKNKVGDTGVRTNLDGAFKQGEIQVTLLGCYASNGTCNASTPPAFAAALCPAAGAGVQLFYNSIIASQIAAAKSAGGTSLATCISTAGGRDFAIAVPLKSDQTKAWCVDSTGVSKQISTGNTTAYTQATLNADVAGSVCGL